MSFAPSSSLVRRMLAGHSWLGLLAGALMYFVCLSGTLAVFFEEFERWEQPRVEEFRSMDPRTAEAGFNALLRRGIEITPHTWLVLPTASVPRARVATEKESWFLNADGSTGQREGNQWTEMLLDLHLYLHLPEAWGMILVSALGVMLVSLMVSGLIAHPRIFRDAFRLRRGGPRHLEQADLHNRLGVWGLPFHLMIAVTGAWFGLALPVLAVVAEAERGGDRAAVVASVFGDEPELEQPPGDLAIARGLEHVTTMDPDAEPFLVTAHDLGEPGQYYSVSATHPGRLIYAENYLFDAAGNFLRTEGFSDGPAGKQVLYSIYRLHFGHFGGFPVKLIYGVMGLVLTVVAATGINVWLARRRTRDFLNRLWPAMVWGLPAALVVSAIAQVLLGLPAAPWFWFPLALAGLLGLRVDSSRAIADVLQLFCGVGMAVLLAGYALHFGRAAATPGALGVNAGLLGASFVFCWLASRSRSRAPVVSRGTA